MWPGSAGGWHGFTLVELLVVIAILGILAGLLLPVLAKAKDRAIRLTDINNLKQQVTAMHLYCSDSGDVLPWPNWFAGDGPNRHGWLYTLDPSATGPARFKAETGVFWKTLQNARLYRCPLEKSNTPLFALRDQQISSYVMNGAVIGYDRMVQPSVRLGSLGPDAVAFWETDEEVPHDFNDGASYAKEGVSARHSLGAIHATFGGQVGFIKFDDRYRERVSAAEAAGVVTEPREAWQQRVTDATGFERLCVAGLRSVGIPARRRPDGRAELWHGAGWQATPKPIVP